MQKTISEIMSEEKTAFRELDRLVNENDRLRRKVDHLTAALLKIVYNQDAVREIAKAALAKMKPKIEPSREGFGSHKMGELVGLTYQQVVDVLGFEPNIEDDPHKVVNSWSFLADGNKCAVWDYKGSHEWGTWSVYGKREVFEALFGKSYVA